MIDDLIKAQQDYVQLHIDNLERERKLAARTIEILESLRTWKYIDLVEKVSPHSHKADLLIWLKPVPLIRDVMPMIEELDCAGLLDPVVVTKARGTSFQPESRCSDAYSERVGCCTCEAEWVDERYIRFFLTWSPHCIEVKAPLSGKEIQRFHTGYSREDKQRYGHAGYWECKDVSGTFINKIRWASGGDDTPNRFTLY